MRTKPRPRRELHPAAFAAVRPFFRHSYERDAWVLVMVGKRIGPVIRCRVRGVASSNGHQHPPSA